MRIAYSLIAYQNLDYENKEFIKNSFSCYEHTPRSIEQCEFNLTESCVTGVQGLLYGLNASYSLTSSKEDFHKLCEHLVKLFQLVPFRTDFIYGAPRTRVIQKDERSFVIDRAKFLDGLAKEYSQNLFFEALPQDYCDFLNTHEELLELKPRIHVDTATLLSQKIGPDWVASNLDKIDRIHLSIPDYTSCFRKYSSFFEELSNYLSTFNGKIIIEVQEVNKEFREDITWLCELF